MKISEQKYKYLYMIDSLKKRLKRGEQKIIADKMGKDSQAISGILNGSRITNIENLREIASFIGLKSTEIKKLEKEASKYAYNEIYGEEIAKKSDNIEDLDVMLSREYGINDEASIRDIKKYIEFIKNK